MGSIQIGKIRGIPIQIHISWLFIFVLVVWSLAASYFPENYPGWDRGLYWLTAIVSAAAFFSSILAHELSHSIVAMSRGIPVHSITLFIFGGVSQLGEEAEDPVDEFLVSVVGPLTSLAIGGLLWLIGFGVGAAGSPIAAAIAYLVYVNVLVGIFNMAPAFPLDGGRVLRAIIWTAQGSLERATRSATAISQTIAFVMIGGGLLYAFTGGGFSGIWIALIGWFLQNSAAASYQDVVLRRSLQGVTARTILSDEFVPVSPNISLQELVDSYILSSNQRAFPVLSDGNLLGLISLTDVKGVPREEWTLTTVRAAMTPRERLQTSTPQEPLADVLSRIAAHDLNQVPVLEDGRLVGFVTRGGIMQYLHIRQELGSR